jgi:mRNA interferase MazF
MPNPKPGEIWLVRFPFSDLTSTKVRPAFVLATHRQEAIILGIFSKIPSDAIGHTALLIEITHPNFAQTGLVKTSLLRADKIATAHQSTFQRQLGTLPADFKPELQIAIKQALNLA